MHTDEIVTNKNNKRISCLAIASFILSIVAVPFVVVCSIILRTVTYNPTLVQVGRSILYVSYALIPASFLLGIGGLIHITLKRKLYCGYWVSLSGICLSVILVVVLFYNLLKAMGEHMW
jgi:hypothetical protein